MGLTKEAETGLRNLTVILGELLPFELRWEDIVEALKTNEFELSYASLNFVLERVEKQPAVLTDDLQLSIIISDATARAGRRAGLNQYEAFLYGEWVASMVTGSSRISISLKDMIDALKKAFSLAVFGDKQQIAKLYLSPSLDYWRADSARLRKGFLAALVVAKFLCQGIGDTNT